ncbi:TrfB-related DNA-binding protein (plasmid) [Methylocaldum sp. MU1018]|jgi:hypothetical protein
MAGALTPSEFDQAIARFPRMSIKARNVARAILVDGLTFEEVTNLYNTSRQLAHSWASKVYEAFTPAGWESELIVLPPEKMKLVRDMERNARAEWENSLGHARIVRQRA